MSKDIDKLVDAIDRLVAVLNPKIPDVDAEIRMETTVPLEHLQPGITAFAVRELAKAKIGEGVERKKIKAMITKLGAETIGDLDAKGLIKLHKKLKTI